MKQLQLLMTILVLSLVLASCGSRRDVVYFQDADLAEVSKSINNYNPTIRPDDMLTIVVSALDQDLARPFNLPAVSFVGTTGQVNPTALQSYLVDANGNIEFPVLGTIKLGGLTRIQAASLLKSQLKEYLKDPIVNIRTVNFKVTVLGEVISPGTYTIQNERLTILEAIGLAGDLTLYAKRQNVLVIREIDGKKTYNRVDLTSETVFNSPVYYLSQNDVIYIEPNNSRVKSSSVGPNTTTVLGVISTLAGLATVIISITN